MLYKKMGIFESREKPRYVTCVAFNQNGDVLTGDSNGNIIVWARGNIFVLRKNWTNNWKKFAQSDYFLSFFHVEYILSSLFSKVVENFISNEMSHKIFQSDKNYRFLIVGVDRQILIVFIFFWII